MKLKQLAKTSALGLIGLVFLAMIVMLCINNDKLNSELDLLKQTHTGRIIGVIPDCPNYHVTLVQEFEVEPGMGCTLMSCLDDSISIRPGHIDFLT